jgi:hypothetical protein
MTEENSPELDPFVCLHEHMHELILQHCTSSEVLNVFLVSTVWNEIASNSKKCMQKVKFGFSQIPWTNSWPQKVSEMLETKRKYRHINGQFVYTTLAVKILKILEESPMSPIELEVRIDKENGYYGRCPLPETFNFPRLESLDVRRILSSALKIKLISSTTRLKQLSIDLIMSPDLVRCLKNLNNLRDLELYGLREFLFRQNSLEDVKFSLRTLKFTDASKINIVTRNNLEKFLTKMGASLTTLHLEFSYAEDIEFITKNLPKLRVLKLMYVKDDWLNVNLKSNRNIKELKILELSENFKKLILKLKYLENLSVEKITRANFEWVVRNVKRLKKFSVAIWGIELPNSYQKSAQEVVMEHYNQLKDSNPLINQRIEIVKY